MPNPPPAPATPELVRPSLAELFIAFATISLSGFGGVLAWSRRMMVEQRKWLTPEQFNETYALCAFLPGGNVINFSVIFGLRIRGAPGSLVAIAGLMVATVAKMARPLFRDSAVIRPLIGLATFIAIGVVHWPLPLVLAVIVPVSIGIAWVRV